MKKIFPVLFILVFTPAIVSCTIDHLVVTHYIYKNSTSDEITVTSYSVLSEDEEGIEETFKIPALGQYTHSVDTEAFRDPLYLYENPSGRDSVIISNTKVQFIQRRWLKDKLYFRENYKFVSSKKHEGTYEYIFTEDDFVNGTPLE